MSAGMIPWEPPRAPVLAACPCCGEERLEIEEMELERSTMDDFSLGRRRRVFSTLGSIKLKQTLVCTACNAVVKVSIERAL